jgi:hypothetical protein
MSRILSHMCPGLKKLVELGYVLVGYENIDDKGTTLSVRLVGPGEHEWLGRQVPDTITIGHCPCCGERFYWGPTRFSDRDERCDAGEGIDLPDKA